MFGPGSYLCGHSVKAMIGYSFDIRRDEEGFNVCPCCGVREYGWRSPTLVKPDGGTALDYVKAHHRTNSSSSKPFPIFTGMTKLEKITQDALEYMRNRQANQELTVAA